VSGDGGVGGGGGGGSTGGCSLLFSGQFSHAVAAQVAVETKGLKRTIVFQVQVLEPSGSVQGQSGVNLHRPTTLPLLAADRARASMPAVGVPGWRGAGCSRGLGLGFTVKGLRFMV
jgi:hypothetical protein